MAMTIEQQRALAMASARRRMAEEKAMSAPSAPPTMVPKFGDPGVGDSDVPGYVQTPEEAAMPIQGRAQVPDAAPQWARDNPDLYRAAVNAEAAIGGTVEVGLPLAAGTLGAGATPFFPPAGAIAGAGLGYGAAKEIRRPVREYLGLDAARQGIEQVTVPIENALTGAAYEAGGRVVVPAVSNVLARTAGTVMDVGGPNSIFSPARREAVRIARESTAGKLDEVSNALAAAKPGDTAAQALARGETNVPVTQALLKSARELDPTFYADMDAATKAGHVNALNKMARGGTQTEATAARGAFKKSLNAKTQPIKDKILKVVDTVNRGLLNLEKEVAENSAAASSSVDDVRRYASAGEKATERSMNVYKPSGQPRVPGRYTHMGELAQYSDELMDRAAKASLDFGEARRFAQSALDDYAAFGIKPIDPEALKQSISATMTAEKAGDDVAAQTIKNVIEDIDQWTSKSGVIDPVALEAIRKNAATRAVNQLRPGMTSDMQSTAASRAMNDIKPIIDGAFAKAGGGDKYAQYLKVYSRGMRKMSDMKFMAAVKDMYENQPRTFAKLVSGNAPDKVEKILGPGRFDIDKELSQNVVKNLRSIADDLRVEKEALNQAKQGGKALGEIINENRIRVRFPNFLRAEVTLTNKALDEIELKVNKKTFDIIKNASRDAKTFKELLDNVPAVERNKVLKAMADTGELARMLPSGTGIATKNALSNDTENKNALAR